MTGLSAARLAGRDGCPTRFHVVPARPAPLPPARRFFTRPRRRSARTSLWPTVLARCGSRRFEGRFGPDSRHGARGRHGTRVYVALRAVAAIAAVDPSGVRGSVAEIAVRDQDAAFVQRTTRGQALGPHHLIGANHRR